MAYDTDPLNNGAKQLPPKEEKQSESGKGSKK